MEQQENYPFPIVSQPQNKENLVLQTTPERIAELVEHQLRGESYDMNKNEWIVTRNPIMNERGIDNYIMLIKNFLNQNSTLSNLTEVQLQRQAIAFGDSLAKALTVNTKRWELDRSVRTPLLMGTVSLIYNVLSRGLGKTMSDKELYSTTIRSQETQMYRLSDFKEKKGIFGFFRRGRNEPQT